MENSSSLKTMEKGVQLQLSKISILVVDDEPHIQKLLKKALEMEGFVATTASSGEEALQLISDHDFPLVISDISMPGMDGLELMKLIKLRHDTDIIIVTGQTQTYHYEDLIHLGASDFVTKPINLKEMIIRIKRVLNERRLREELVHFHQELARSQKLESIGQLAAGIAHEINTPIQYIGDNTTFLKDSFQEILTLIEELQSIAERLQTSEEPLPAQKLVQLLEEADMEYLAEEIPIAINQSMDGVRRVQKIVTSMKEFSHPGGKEKAWSDLNHIIETTVTVATNEWKYCADLSLELAEDMGKIYCDQGELSQVVLNMVINAAHAIEEKHQATPEKKGRITIQTRKAADWAEIRISDTGTGIPSENLEKIFNPFFTTKEVGKGTGQGLAISRSVIEDGHHGRLVVETAEGEGATFIIRLPLVVESSTSTCKR